MNADERAEIDRRQWMREKVDMNDSTKDWPQSLQANVVALQLAPSIYYARATLYDPEMPHWNIATQDIRQRYIELAQRVLTELAPIVVQHPKVSPQPYTMPPIDTQHRPVCVGESHTFTVVPRPACEQCHTRDQSKHYAPYCSHICEQAAQTRADGSEDRR